VRLLVVNANTSVAMTREIRAEAQAAASPGTEILAATPRFGPASVESILESHLAAVGIIDCALREAGGCDAVVLAGFGELGREALQELLAVPAIDITDAAAQIACLLGRRFGVVTTLARAIPAIEDRLVLSGFATRCVAVRAIDMAVLDLAADVAATIAAVTAAVRSVVRDDGAEVVCLGCAGMAGIANQVSAEVGVPVVDGLSAAVRLAEALYGLGLRTSKVGFSAPSPDKHIAGWPFSWPALDDAQTQEASGTRTS
jgi:allantoin racemase